MNNKPYTLFSLEDFLTDEFFISSVGNPTHESMAFWNGYASSNPPNIIEYLSAKQYILSSGNVQPLITDEEVSEVWAGISGKTGPGGHRSRGRRRIFTVTGIVAACAAVALLVFLSPVGTKRDGMYDYAVGSADSTGRKEARLILSDNNSVVIEDRNASITYKAASITISEREVAKDATGYNQLIIPNGKMSKLTLADGTAVWVNANTRVVYPVEFPGKRREIYVDGEVFLDVARDEKRPFIVKTRHMDIEVFGTRFNVCSRDDRELRRVVLVEGSVGIIPEGTKKRSMLKPDQMYESSAGAAHIEEVDVRHHTSWIEGLYFFEHEPLNMVAERLSEHYAVEIECDGQAAEFLCSGKLDIRDDVEDVIGVLCRTMPLQCERTGENVFVLRLKNT